MLLPAAGASLESPSPSSIRYKYLGGKTSLTERKPVRKWTEKAGQINKAGHMGGARTLVAPAYDVPFRIAHRTHGDTAAHPAAGL